MKRQPRARCKEQETALIHPPSCKVVGNGQRVKKPNSVPFVRISDVGEETIMGEERKCAKISVDLQKVVKEQPRAKTQMVQDANEELQSCGCEKKYVGIGSIV
ncbi:predicted protein [Sclerotinia sclerotiorum 1980 UF-70]|uniref:Uncharacterized protein n=1 Tax=Sclerotinia sclerotiorum (strain ATCC 18683 / 1980 / Ss-1) TaxID=665079 RepID=A7EXP0_SCLS1|nr:predicted protein [Sclerotinia sclerotiorum 1980 UF-70]EDN94232.1 predicted protein [Sclerotinia sclerotiorum 1980 UF-70]